MSGPIDPIGMLKARLFAQHLEGEIPVSEEEEMSGKPYDPAEVLRQARELRDFVTGRSNRERR